jgi:hypothetical protein
MNPTPHRFREVLTALLPLLLAACAAARPPESSPASPQSPPPAEIEDTRLNPVADPAAGIGAAGLAAARACVILRLPGAARALLDATLEAAPGIDPGLRAQALYLRGFLAWEAGDSEGAVADLDAAASGDPLGPLAEPAVLSRRMVLALAAQEGDLRRLQTEIAASRQERQRESERAKGLETEVEALTRQLNELKEVHLRVESEKKDDPS